MPNRMSEFFSRNAILYCNVLCYREYRDLSKALVHPITHTAIYRSPKPSEIKEGDEFFVYGRYGNPSLRALEATLASIEGAKHAFCFGTGVCLYALRSTILIQAIK